MDFLEKKLRLPVYKFWVDPLEKHGIPSFPTTIIAIIAIICLLFLGISSALAPAYGNLQVSVKADATPVADALVTLSIGSKELTAYTDENGKVLFEKLKYGEKAELSAEKTGYPTYSRTITISPNANVNLKDSSGEGTNKATITITDSYKVPITANVHFAWKQGKQDQEDNTQSNAAGEAILYLEKPAQVTATASAPGFSTETISFNASGNVRKEITLKWLGAKDKATYLANARAAYGQAAGDKIAAAFNSLLEMGFSEEELLLLTPNELISKEAKENKKGKSSDFASLLAKGEADVYGEDGKIVTTCENGITKTTVDSNGNAVVTCEDGSTRNGTVIPRNNNETNGNNSNGTGNGNGDGTGDGNGDGTGPGQTDPYATPDCILFKTTDGQIKAFVKRGEAITELSENSYTIIRENVTGFISNICAIPFIPANESAWLFKTTINADCAGLQEFNYDELKDANLATHTIKFDSRKNSQCNQLLAPAPKTVRVELETSNTQSIGNSFLFDFYFKNLLANNSFCSQDAECACDSCVETPAGTSKCCFKPSAPGEACEDAAYCQNGLICNSATASGQKYCCANGQCCSKDSDCGSATQVCSQNNNCVSCGEYNQPACSSGCAPGLVVEGSTCKDNRTPASLIAIPLNNSKYALKDLQGTTSNKKLFITGNASDSSHPNLPEQGSHTANVTVTIEVFNDSMQAFQTIQGFPKKAEGTTSWNFTWDVPTALNGNRTRIWAQATDKAGNTEAKDKYVEIRVDRQKPELKPTNDFIITEDATNKTKATIYWNATERVISNLSYYYERPDGTKSDVVQIISTQLKTNGSIAATNIPVVPNGETTIMLLTICDDFGNCAPTKTKNYIPTDPCQAAFNKKCGTPDAVTSNIQCDENKGKIYNISMTYSCETGVCVKTEKPNYNKVFKECTYWNPLLVIGLPLFGLLFTFNDCTTLTNGQPKCCVGRESLGGCNSNADCCPGTTCQSRSLYYYDYTESKIKAITIPICIDNTAYKSEGQTCGKDNDCYPTLFCDYGKCKRCLGPNEVYYLPQGSTALANPEKLCCPGNLNVVDVSGFGYGGTKIYQCKAIAENEPVKTCAEHTDCAENEYCDYYQKCQPCIQSGYYNGVLWEGDLDKTMKAICCSSQYTKSENDAGLYLYCKP